VCLVGFIDAWSGRQAFIQTDDIIELRDNPVLSPTCPDKTTHIKLKDLYITCAPYTFTEFMAKLERECFNKKAS
jgi:hypothetical protein